MKLLRLKTSGNCTPVLVGVMRSDRKSSLPTRASTCPPALSGQPPRPGCTAPAQPFNSAERGTGWACEPTKAPTLTGLPRAMQAMLHRGQELTTQTWKLERVWLGYSGGTSLIVFPSLLVGTCSPIVVTRNYSLTRASVVQLRN